ncbi:Hpt domain protein [[Leptolyngbya] sp. PCC 7376]|uniref:Hpt domain-containing protein n=1 Tax=[Leptolyngbya] sp. PCC 7376 TaxID=111781 RepID=UPI00029F0393|nr:Hpt domain-containing protein [[Leptolyngbya] sp. PCC 7376]AFY40527.1 Hpt domain protein [[Leptolyngbya] sp. PCC 7376]
MSDDSLSVSAISLDDLTSIVGDDPDVLRDVVNAFLEDSPKLLDGMKEAFDAKDLEVLERNAHTLKSSSRLFRAEQFATQCQTIEACAKNSDWPVITEEMPKLCQNFEVIAQALEAELNKL